jgi:hypothetical protein
MQNSTLPGAFDELRKNNLRTEKVSRKLRILRKKLEIQKPKSLNLEKARAEKAQLVNLRLAIELRKKMDAVPQKINKND